MGTGVFVRFTVVFGGAGGSLWMAGVFGLERVFVVEETLDWSPRIMLLMSAKDCEL